MAKSECELPQKKEDLIIKLTQQELYSIDVHSCRSLFFYVQGKKLLYRYAQLMLVYNLESILP